MSWIVCAAVVVVGVVVVRAILRRRAAQRQAVWTELYGAEVAEALHAAKVERHARRRLAGRRRRRIDDLTAILSIDPDARVCVAEPAVTIGDLVAATLRHGLVPAVVPARASLTIGELVPVDDDAYRREVALIPARRFVRVRHHGFQRRDELEAARRAHRGQLVDALVLGPGRYVLTVATFVSEAPYLSRHRWPGSYLRSTVVRGEDYLRTEDFVLRDDRGRGLAPAPAAAALTGDAGSPAPWPDRAAPRPHRPRPPAG